MVDQSLPTSTKSWFLNSAHFNVYLCNKEEDIINHYIAVGEKYLSWGTNLSRYRTKVCLLLADGSHWRLLEVGG